MKKKIKAFLWKETKVFFRLVLFSLIIVVLVLLITEIGSLFTEWKEKPDVYQNDGRAIRADG